MYVRPPNVTRHNTLFPYPTLFRSGTDMPAHSDGAAGQAIAAAAVAMPSAEQIAALASGAGSVAGDQNSQVDAAAEHNQVVGRVLRSEEHTSELQSLMRISYAVFCLKKKKQK